MFEWWITQQADVEMNFYFKKLDLILSGMFSQYFYYFLIKCWIKKLGFLFLQDPYNINGYRKIWTVINPWRTFWVHYVILTNIFL